MVEGGRTIAALGMAGPLYRLDEPRRAAIIAGIRAGAAELSAQLR